jgi:aspartyl/asparaginyl beta-hydroxylase (cupin superfamily)
MNVMKGMYSESDVENLRVKLLAMEALPTVREGMKALQMNSLLDWLRSPEQFCRRRNEFAHPLQRPYIFFPGLRAKMFWSADDFPWAARVEAEAGRVIEELEGVMRSRRGFQPFRHIEDGTFLMAGDKNGTGPDDRPDWNMFYFYFVGNRVEANCELCPRTAELLASIPRFTDTSIASFSALNPGANIPPHYGPTNAVLRVHLGLHTPGGCRIRVGTKVSEWQSGRLLFLNDAFEHQVWHEGSETRIVLFFDVLHPDWRDEELPMVDSFLRHGGPGGLSDFLSGMQQLREEDRLRLDGTKWWT